MTRIGVISDTHGWLHPDIKKYFKDCDQIWHAGDIGSIDLINELVEIAPVHAVFGNIDDLHTRKMYKEFRLFLVEDLKIWMTHIGGYPGRYAPGIPALLNQHKPNIFVCGHSHILKIMPDKKRNMLHINPGAAGQFGFHLVKTLVRFTIDGSKMDNMEVIELPEMQKKL
ncbi:MAG: metallophosphoesterase family protein [Bacteroidota bacterium]